MAQALSRRAGRRRAARWTTAGRSNWA